MLPASLGRSILLRSPNWLGDIVMALPSVRAILAARDNGTPDTTVSVAAPAHLHPVWKLIDGIDLVLPTTKKIGRTAATLRPHRFTSALLYPNSWRAPLEALFAGIPKIYGFRGHGRGLLLTRAFTKEVPPACVQHQSLDYLDLFAQLGIPHDGTPAFPALRPVPPPASTPGPVLAICPGAEYGPAKRWPPASFATVARELRDSHGLHPVLLGSAGDAPACAETAALLGAPCLDLAGKTSLDQFISHLAHARLVLCNDSGSMHLCALLDTPAVAIFGSTEPRLTGPLGNSVRIVREHVPCSPCFLRSCPYGHFDCLHGVTPDRVLAEARALLDTPRR